MNAVNSTRRRSSGTRHALASQESSALRLALGLVGFGVVAAALRVRRSRPLGGLGLGASSAERRATLCFLAFRTFGSLRSVSVPPAASTFSRAVAEAPWTVIESFFVSSPTPSSFTSLRTERIRPFAFSVSGVTSSPASKRSRSRRFTGCV